MINWKRYALVIAGAYIYAVLLCFSLQASQVAAFFIGVVTMYAATWYFRPYYTKKDQ